MEPSWLKTSPSHRDARGKFAQQHPQRLLCPTEQQCSVCGFWSACHCTIKQEKGWPSWELWLITKIQALHFRASNHNAERVNELLSHIQDCDHQHSSYVTTPKPQRRKFDIPKGRLLLRAANANHRQLKNLEDCLWFSFFKRVSKFALFQWYKFKNNNTKKNHENKEQNSAKAKNLAQYAKEGLQKIM
jgi:hypothetical protein